MVVSRIELNVELMELDSVKAVWKEQHMNLMEHKNHDEPMLSYKAVAGLCHMSYKENSMRI